MATTASSNISLSAEKQQDLSQDVIANLCTCINMDVSLQEVGSPWADAPLTGRHNEPAVNRNIFTNSILFCSQQSCLETEILSVVVLVRPKEWQHNHCSDCGGWLFGLPVITFLMSTSIYLTTYPWGLPQLSIPEGEYAGIIEIKHTPSTPSHSTHTHTHTHTHRHSCVVLNTAPQQSTAPSEWF